MSDRTSNVPPTVSRRALLQLLGAVGTASWLSFGARALAGCPVTPASTLGPFWSDRVLHRSDIRIDPVDGTTTPGVPLVLALTVRHAEASCAPAAGLRVDLWNCDAAGRYSDDGKSFLRGYQVTDQNGVARFTTIFPGWYPGRTVHVHVRVRAFEDATPTFDFASQLYFEDATSDRILALPPYDARGPRRVTNANDGIYGPETRIALARDGSGYASSFDLALKGFPPPMS